MNGYIALHRKIMSSTVFSDDGLFKMWCYCLMRANHKPCDVIHDGTLIKIEAGQFITGRKALAKDLNSTEQKVRSRIALLEKMGNIIVKSTNRYSIITVVKWEDYQTNRNILTNRQPTDNQQITTDNNVNNVNNVNNSSGQGPADKDMGFNKYADDYEEEVQVDPDFKPEKKQKKAADNIQAVFDLFSNPAKPTWRLRELERVAAQTLFDTYGIDTLKKRLLKIEMLKKQYSDDPFFPIVNTPSTLLDKMESVERYLKI